MELIVNSRKRYGIHSEFEKEIVRQKKNEFAKEIVNSRPIREWSHSEFAKKIVNK